MDIKKKKKKKKIQIKNQPLTFGQQISYHTHDSKLSSNYFWTKKKTKNKKINTHKQRSMEEQKNKKKD